MCVEECWLYVCHASFSHCLHYHLLYIFPRSFYSMYSLCSQCRFILCVYAFWDVLHDTKILMNIKDPLTPLVHSSSNPFSTHTFICIYDPSDMMKVLMCDCVCTNKLLPLQVMGIGLRRVADAWENLKYRNVISCKWSFKNSKLICK